MWPGTIDTVGRLDFQHVLGGHGTVQDTRTPMTSLRNYIEELTTRVEEGKRAGLTLAEMQKRITVASLKSLQSNGYADYITRNMEQSIAHFGPMDSLQSNVNGNIGDVLKNLDRA